MSRTFDPTFTSPSTRNRWSQFLEQAALIGPFDPIALVGRPESEGAIEVLSALGQECVEVVSGGPPHWQLSSDARRRVLHDLSVEGRLERVAAAADPADDFGRYLVDTVLGRLHIPAEASLGELDVIRTAVQFAAGVAPAAEELAAVDRAVAREERREAIRSLIPQGLVGREHYLRRLRHFVDLPVTGRLPILMISGTGGVGKSALLATFIQRSRRRLGDGIPVVWLDFDRAILSETDPTALTLEFARQLGLAVPNLARQLSAFRAAVAKRHDAERHEDGESATDRFFRQSLGWSDWNDFGLRGALHGQTIILVLDTLEEILVHDDGRDDELMRWIGGLVGEGGASGLRVVLSGRAEERFETWARNLDAQHIRLGDLGPVSAVRLLIRHLGDSALPPYVFPLHELVEHYGGNPLTLKVLGLYLRDSEPAAARDLLADSGRRRFDERFAQQYLYRRILGRIRSSDPDLIRIAHPGLILRRVTPDLIQQVLAKPCGLGPIDAERAQRLFAALAAQVWLVEPGSTPQTIRHRRDLRRLIFGAMNAAEGEKARAIHAAAADYYAAHCDAHLSAEKQDFEALYHRIFADPGMTMDDDLLRRLSIELGQDSADLPLDLRARLKLAQGKGLELEEFESLGRDDRITLSVQRDQAAIRRGARPSAGRGGGNRPFAGEAGIEAERAYIEADFDRLLRLRHAVFDEFVETVLLGRGSGRSRPRDLTDTGLWRVSLAVLGTAEERRFASRITHIVIENRERVEWHRPLNPNRKMSISIAQALEALVRLLGAHPPSELLEHHDRWRGDAPIETTEQLRVRQLARDDPMRAQSERVTRVSLALLQYLSPQFSETAETLTRNNFSVHSYAREALDRISRVTGRGSTLSAVEGGRMRQAFVEVGPTGFANSATGRVLRGISPELYPLVQAAAGAVPRIALVDFVKALEPATLLWPRELEGPRFDASLAQDRARWTATLIDTADRFGMLGKLADFLAERAGSDNRPRQVARLVRLYGGRLLP